jgi:adenylate cyclase
MTMEDFKRKLTTIFSADVAGYSRLMGEDEVATVKTLTAYRRPEEGTLLKIITIHGHGIVSLEGTLVLKQLIYI